MQWTVCTSHDGCKTQAAHVVTNNTTVRKAAHVVTTNVRSYAKSVQLWPRYSVFQDRLLGVRCKSWVPGRWGRIPTDQMSRKHALWICTWLNQGGLVMLSVDYFTWWRMQYQCKREFKAVAGCRKGWLIIFNFFLKLIQECTFISLGEVITVLDIYSSIICRIWKRGGGKMWRFHITCLVHHWGKLGKQGGLRLTTWSFIWWTRRRLLCGRRVRDCMSVVDPVGGQRKGVNCDVLALNFRG